jgi:transcriptional regulator with XRE-family HTH domain
MDVPANLLRAARSALGISREEVANSSGVSARTVAKIELQEHVKLETMRKVQAGLETRGIRFLDFGGGEGPGIRLPANWRPENDGKVSGKKSGQKPQKAMKKR